MVVKGLVLSRTKPFTTKNFENSPIQIIREMDFHTIPSELIELVCTYLPGRSIFSFLRTSKTIRDAIDDERIWRYFMERDYPFSPFVCPKDKFRGLTRNQIDYFEFGGVDIWSPRVGNEVSIQFSWSTNPWMGYCPFDCKVVKVNEKDKLVTLKCQRERVLLEFKQPGRWEYSKKNLGKIPAIRPGPLQRVYHNDIPLCHDAHGYLS